MESWVLYGGSAAAVGAASYRLYRAYRMKTRAELINEALTIAFVTWVFFVPLVHMAILWGRARGAQRAWAAGHTLCKISEHASALAGHAGTRHFCVDAAGHDRTLIAIWAELVFERGPMGLWTGSTYDEIMTGMETASVQSYMVRLIVPLALLVLTGVYVIKELGVDTVKKLWGHSAPPVVIDRGDRVCFRGLSGKEICMHKNPPSAAPTA